MKRLIGLLAVLSCAACFPSIRETFADLTYPQTPASVPPRDRALSLTSALLPVLLSGYRTPAAAADCYASLASAPGTFAELDTLGACLADPAAGPSGVPGVPQDHWIQCTNASATLLRSCESALSDPVDRAQAALALANLAEIFYAYRLSTTLQTTAAPLSSEDQAALLDVLRLAVELLECDPSNAGAGGVCDPTLAPTGTTERGSRPALSLSGGSANGAFSAGFLFALLGAREEAVAAAAGDPSKVAALEAERFGVVTGTSIGTLLALLVDLYFSDLDPTALPAGHPAIAHLHDYLGPGALPPRAAQRCALAMLEKELTESDETDVLCVEDGSLRDLLENDDNMVRFDPLEARVITPFLASYGEIIAANDLIRVAMSVDFNNNSLIGLDERACRLPGMAPMVQCAGSAVLASIVLPALVEKVTRVYSGLEGSNGEPGFWLDGGVRSKSPALHAIALTQTAGPKAARLLAINNSRAEGIPHQAPEVVLAVTFAAMDQFAAQVSEWEMAMAGLWSQVQRARGCFLAQQLGYASCGALTPPSAGRVLMRMNRSPLGGSLLPIFVPEHVPSFYSAAGYAFDPEVMRGLFFWGQKTFLDQRQAVLTFLDWPTVANQAATWMATRAAAVDAEIASRYAVSPTPLQQAVRNQTRNALLKNALPTCP